MFPESSRWQAEIVRVTSRRGAGAGDRAVGRLPVGGAGARWGSRRTRTGASTPIPASTASSPFSSSAMEWVADNTPRDTETRYLEAVVTTWHNTDPPQVVVLRTDEREPPGDGDRPRPGRRPTATRLDDWLGRRVSMRALALLRSARRADRGAPPVAFSSAARAQLDLPRPLPRSVRGVVPGAAPRRLHRRALGRRRRRRRHDDRARRTRSATSTTFAIVTYNVFLSTTHFHNNRAYLIIVLAALAVGAVRARAFGRRLVARPAPAPAARPDVAGLAAVAAAVRGRRRVRRLRAEQAASTADWFGGTVTWHRFMLRTRPPGRLTPAGMGGRRCSATARSTPWPPRSSSPPSCSLPSGCAGGRRASRPSGSRSASTCRSSSTASVRGVLVPGDRRARDLGHAVDQGPGAGDQRPPTSPKLPRGGARLAGSLPHRGRAARLGCPCPRTRRHRSLAGRRRRRARRQPAPTDGVVRVAGAAAAERPARSTGRPPVDGR